MLDESETAADVVAAFAKINGGRAQVGQTNARLTVLRTAVKLMAQSTNKHKDLTENCCGLLSREAMVSNVKPGDFARRVGDLSLIHI